MGTFSQMTASTAIIAALDTLPNDVGGLTDEQFKAKFDESPTAIKTFINNVLISELNTLAANKLDDNFTASRVIVSSSGGSATVSAVTTTELGYLSGVTSAIQTQLDGKPNNTSSLAGYGITDAYTKDELNNGQLNNLYYTETELNNGQLNNLYYTETELNAGQLDTLYLKKTNTASYTPTSNYHPSTKKYVDDTVASATLGALPDNSIENAKLDEDVKVGSLAASTNTDTSSVIAITNELNANKADLVDGNVPASQLGNVPLTSINKELANIEAVLDVDSRALQNNGKVYDLLDGTNNYSCGQLDTTKTTASSQIYNTDATTLLMTSHGLITGDLINNTTRSTPSIVTKVSDNVLTTGTITGQIGGDSIKKYPKQVGKDYTADLCTGGTAISGGDDTTFVASRAFDNNTSNEWESSQTGTAVNGTAYIGYHFSSAKHIRKFIITNTALGTGFIPASVKLQKSDNGSTWTDVQTFTMVQDGSAQSFTVNASSAAVYWRLLANSAVTTNYQWRVAEIEMMEFATTSTTESGTTTTNIKITGHGLSTGDFIRNTTRSNAIRQVTKADDDNLTVSTVASQTAGDSIECYKYSADDTAEAPSTIAVTSATGFSAGQEITIFDDTNLERPIISSITDNNITFTSALTKGYKSGANVCRSSVTVNTASSFITFGGWGTYSVLVEDFRYNITPPLGTTDELAMWLYNEKDAGFSISGSLSIVDTSANESYSTMTKTTTSLGASTEENQFVGSVATAQEKVTFRGTIARTGTSVDKDITKVLGAIA